MNAYFKYPRTFHFAWSEGLSDDDKMLPSSTIFSGKKVVVTEKLDGENTTLYSDHIHARSIDSKHHPSRNWVKVLHGNIKHEIPKGFRICGENLYAHHSIHYRNLETYFYVFAVYDGKDCLSWDDTKSYAEMLGLTLAPVLYYGKYDEEKVKACFTGNSVASPGDPQEGYVLRLAESFLWTGHSESAAKFVRANHVQTDEHWLTKPVVPNLLRKL